MSENAAPNEELEMLREELSSTRRYARNLHNDRSHLEVSRSEIPSISLNKSKIRKLNHRNEMRLSPQTLHRHNQYVFDDGHSEAPSMLSSMSTWNAGGDPVFNFKITDSCGNNRRFVALQHLFEYYMSALLVAYHSI